MDEIPIEEVLAVKPLSTAAKEEVLRRFDRFCHLMAVRIMRSSYSFAHGTEEDWTQEARISLLYAADTFDFSRGTKFSTWAYACVWGLLRRIRRKDNGIVRGSTEYLETRPHVGQTQDFELDNIPFKENYNKESTETQDYVENALRCLPERERKLLELRFGIGTGHAAKFDEIAAVMGFSRQRAKQLQANAFWKIRRKHQPPH